MKSVIDGRISFANALIGGRTDPNAAHHVPAREMCG